MKYICLTFCVLTISLAACSGLFTLAPSPTPTEARPPTAVADWSAETGIDVTVQPDGGWYAQDNDGQVFGKIVLGSKPDEYLLQVQTPAGSPLEVPLDSVKTGQGDVLQVYNEVGTEIDYAFDAVEGRWLAHDEVIQTDKSNPENYIQVATWDELKTLFRQEKMFMLPFPEDTYWPPADEIIKEQPTSGHINWEADFDPWFPLGLLDDLSRSPFRFVNYSFLPEGEDRPTDVYLVTEQVYNYNDGSFSLLHFTIDYLQSADGSVEEISDYTADGRYLMPLVKTSMSTGRLNSYSGGRYLRERGYLESDGTFPKIEVLYKQWLTTGHVPVELEEIPLYPRFRFFRQP